MAQVVFHTAFLGDLVLSIPLLRFIKNKYAEDKLILVCRPGVGKFFSDLKLIDDYFEIDKKDSSSIQKFYDYMNCLTVDHVFCPHRSFHTAWILRKVKAQKKIGYATWWSKLFYDECVERKMEFPEAVRVLDLASSTDVNLKNHLINLFSSESHKNLKDLETVDKWPAQISEAVSYGEFSASYLSAVSISDTLEKFKIRTPFAIIAPSSQWVTKRWTKEGFAELASRLLVKDINVYFIGARNEVDECRAVESRALAMSKSLAHSATVEIRSLAGQTSLIELLQLATRASVAVTNDSGPMHMATLVQCPVVAIFGPTTLELGYRPWSNNSAVAQIDLGCRPCGRHGHDQCPIGTHACMKELGVDTVFRSVLKLMRN